jgi:hypothetical protein
LGCPLFSKVACSQTATGTAAKLLGGQFGTEMRGLA